MLVAEKKVLEKADKALVEALMNILEVGRELGAEEKAWREICHARELLKLLLES